MAVQRKAVSPEPIRAVFLSSWMDAFSGFGSNRVRAMTQNMAKKSENV
jgi:hypothetical protein